MISLFEGANPSQIQSYPFSRPSLFRNWTVPEKGLFVFDLHSISKQKRGTLMEFARRLWSQEEGQDIAEYAVMLAVILVIVVGTVRLIGSNANNVFSSVASSIQ
jgi:Flp pilus assembly pilin Flp